MEFDCDKLLSKEDVLLQSLHEFYKNKGHVEKILPIVTGSSDISLRVLDYFVTNYAKNNNIIIKDKLNNYNVYQDYKNKLKSYNKRFFDPFCRINKKNMTNKIAFKYDNENDKFIVTTIGQLNFFRWAIKNKIIDYVVRDHDKINNDMNNLNANKKKYKINNTLDETKKEKYILNTTINFGGSTKKNYKITTTNINDNKFNITKLEFEK
tara:strand:- start:680 stop:1306 length:627 start_codon:yes stop_codon:yes gene_type:complete